jgi:hypothetical protein
MTEGTMNDWAENCIEQALEQKGWEMFNQFKESLAISFTD